MKDAQIQRLQEIFGAENVLCEKEDRIVYSYDASPVEIIPEAVVFATDTEQISRRLHPKGSGNCSLYGQDEPYP